MIKLKKILLTFNIIAFLVVVSLSAILLANFDDVKASFALAQETNQDDEQHDDIEEADYYFDPSAPDGGNGTFQAPFNDLSIINNLTINPGDVIRLKAGSIFPAPFMLENIQGDAENPVLISRYGSGRRPIIAANDRTGGGILHIKNCQYIVVESFEIFDTATLEGDRRGILIEIGGGSEDNILYYNNITIQDMYVHDIRGITDAENSGMSAASKKTGGIVAWTKDRFTAYNNLAIKNNIIRNVDNCGISIWRMPSTSSQGTVYDEDFESKAHKNVEIANNDISNIGKNAIVVRYLLGGFVRENTVYKTAMRCVSGNQIFTRDCKGTVIERNEGFLNMARADSEGVVRDGSMLDADLRSPDTVWQYNYSHDNAFGLMTNCTNVRDNIVVRYNISVADKSYLMNINYDVNSMHIYNNTFFIPENYDAIVIRERKQKLSDRIENQTYIYENNLIYNDSLTASFDFAVAGENGTQNDIVNTVHRSFSNNLLYNAKAEEEGFSMNKSELFEFADGVSGELQPGYLKSNPLLVNAYGGTSIEREGAGILNNFKLLEGSPALGAGKTIENSPAYCFFGNVIASPPNIGAYGGIGENAGSTEEGYLNPDDYATPRFDVVEKIADIVYAENVPTYDGKKTNLKLDIYRPKNDTERNRPLVMMIHGGGFRSDSSKDQNYIVNLSNLFAKHGWVVASIEYRTRPGSALQTEESELAVSLDASEDANRAYAWLRTKGGVYGYNPDYMFVAGGSAGGVTAVMFSYANEDRDFDRSDIVAVGNLWGSPNPSRSPYYSVTNTVDGRSLPMIIIIGSNDTAERLNNSNNMRNSLINAGYIEGTDFTFHIIQGGGHPPTNVTNGTQTIFNYINTFFIVRLKDYIANVTGGVTPPPPPEVQPGQEDYIGPESTGKIIYAKRDTFISSDDAERVENFATANRLLIYGEGATQKSAILRFDIPKSDIYSARLQIRVLSASGVSSKAPQVIDVNIISNDYLVDDITWDSFDHNQQMTKAGTFIITGVGTYTLELKDYIAQQIVNKAMTLSLLLEDSQPGSTAKVEIGAYESADFEPRINLIKAGDSAQPGYTFTSIDDTYLTNSAGHGSATTVKARSSGSSHTMRGFIKFDYSSLNENIESAYLYLYLVSLDTENTQSFSLRVSNFTDWSESTLAWSSEAHPSNGMQSQFNQSVSVTSAEAWLRIDVKNILTSEAFAGKKITFCIYPSSGSTGVSIASKESDNAPYLLINRVEGETPQYNVSVNIVGGVGGNVYISNKTLLRGENLSMVVKPSFGYVVEYVKVNGQDADLSQSLIMLLNVTAEVNIEAKFKVQGLIIASSSTYTREDTPTTEYYDSDILPVKTTRTGTNSRIGYINFSGLTTDVLTKKVTFRIMGSRAVDLGSSPMPIGVYAFAGSAAFGDGIVWNNQPVKTLFDRGETADTAGVTATARLTGGARLGVLSVKSVTWYELDVTDYVRSLVVSGIDEFCLVLIDECNDGTPRYEFYSVQAALENRPQLRFDEPESFEIETVNITVNTDEHGQAFVQSEVTKGQNTEVIIVCDAGYKVSQATVNGQAASVNRNKILLENITQDLEIEISFERITQ
jgi:hypothetical protein